MSDPQQPSTSNDGPLAAVSAFPPSVATPVATALSDPLRKDEGNSGNADINNTTSSEAPPLARSSEGGLEPVESDPLSQAANALSGVDAQDEHPLSGGPGSEALVSDEVELGDNQAPVTVNAHRPSASEPAPQLSSLDPATMALDGTDNTGSAGHNARTPVAAPPRHIDPVEAFLGQPLPPRYTMPVEEAPVDPEGLRMLADSGNWVGVITLSEQCAQKQYHPHEMLQIQLCRIVALTKLHRHRAVVTEFEAIGDLDRPELMFQSHPQLYPGQSGTMVPFTMRVLLAQLPARLGNVQASLDRLWNLVAFCRGEKKRLSGLSAGHAEGKKKGGEGAGTPSTGPTTPSKGSKHKCKDADEILDEIEQIASPTSSRRVSVCSDPDSAAIEGISLSLGSDESVRESIQQWQTREVSLLTQIATHFMSLRQYSAAILIFQDLEKEYPEDPMVLTRLGRMYLETGDLKTAQRYFERVATFVDPGHSVVHMNTGFAAVASGNYPAALDAFENIIKEHPNHLSAANNFAISLLYTCQLRKAIGFLEDLVKKDPYHCLHESVVMNLCTLYELSSDQPKERKRVLQEIVQQYAPQCFNIGAVFS